MHRKFINGMNKAFFGGGSITFQSVLLWRFYNDKKSLPDIGGTTIQDVGPLAAMGAGFHTMSDELILQISCNIFWLLNEY